MTKRIFLIIFFIIFWIVTWICKIIFAALAILSLYLTFCFFMATELDFLSGDLLHDFYYVQAFAFIFSLIILIGVPIMMIDVFKKIDLKDSLRERQFYEPFKWLVIIFISLLFSVFGSIFGLFAVSEFFQIGISLTTIKLVAATSISTNLFATIKIEANKKAENKRNAAYSGYVFKSKAKN